MRKKEIAKRYILFIISLFFVGFGIACTKHVELGVTPISSVANILSYRFEFFSIGNWLIVTNLLMVVAQIALLRKRFDPVQLLQIPLTFVFGYFTDFGMLCVGRIPADIYIVRLAFVIVGVIFLGIGVTLSVIANVVLNSGEGIVKAIADVTNKEFSNVKVIFDVSWVSFSIVLSLILFKGQLVATREGTIITAVCTGFVVKFFKKILHKPITKILEK